MYKSFINQKVGYTSGKMGCTGEYFQLIWFDGEFKAHSIIYQGIYGGEAAISKIMTKNGYTNLYVSVGRFYGKLQAKDVKFALSELQATDKLKEFGFEEAE